MQTYIALFRGINVGGNRTLPMNALKNLLGELDLQHVRTYIQSGNVVFQSERTDKLQLSRQIFAAIQQEHGFEPKVLLMALDEFEQAIELNPFPEAEAEPKTLHIGFLDSVPVEPDLEKLESIRKENERFMLRGKYFYLHAPDGIGWSKLAASAERLLGTSMTDRNWRTVCKIMVMAIEADW
jgi:uncharacterized protein (DUF1697 family)